MTDPDFADRTYIEPLTAEVLAKIIERERPDAVLPTLGGQTALNLAMELVRARGDRPVTAAPELIGANAEAIATAEDRERFKQAMVEIGLHVPASGIAHTLDEAEAVADRARPAGHRAARPTSWAARGTGIAATAEELRRIAAAGLDASPISEILIERSIAGWKEYELEVMRDRADNCVVVCSIENLDPMGVHTGDSITVAPAQTLSDVEYQLMRDAAFACIRRVGVETGGSQRAVRRRPRRRGEHGDHRDEPARVAGRARWRRRPPGSPSPRSPPASPSATPSTRSPTTSPARRRPASSRPSTTSSPRSRAGPSRSCPAPPVCSAPRCRAWARPWPSAAPSPRACRRACARSRAAGSGSTATPGRRPTTASTTTSCCGRCAVPTPERPFQLEAALRRGITRRAGARRATGIDPWFLDQILAIVEERAAPGRRRARRRWTARATGGGPSGSASATPSWPGSGAWPRPTCAPPGWRRACGPRSRPSTRARAEFEAATPYHYSTYEDEDEVEPVRPAQGRHPRLGPQPHRPGHRVRLLLRPRQLRPPRRRLRDGDGQLQPRDGLDRLRHQRPPLLRAADARGRAERDRGRAGGAPAGARS